MTDYPLRVRLYGGRVTHAARKIPSRGTSETVCQYALDVLATNHWLADRTRVNCVTCRRRLRAVTAGGAR